MGQLRRLSHPFGARRRPGAPGTTRSPATPVALAYVLLAGLWILASDRVASLLVPPRHFPELQPIQGWLFVGVTGILLWIVLHGYWRARIGAQERQAQSERRLEEALEALQATLLRVGAREPYPILSVTEGIAALTGHAPEELLGETPGSAMELVHPEDRRWVFTAVRASARDGRRFVFELRLLTGSGEPHWVWCKGRPLPGGETVELFLTDISRLKHLEAQLVEARGVEALAELAAGVAHDVNNLLTAVIGHAELAEHRSRQAAAAPSQHLAEVKQAARRAHELNQRLMRLGRPPGGETCTIDLNELVEETGALLRPMLRRRVTLTCECAPEPVVVEADPHQLERVLVNLAVNARDAMPAGGRLSFTAAVVEGESRADPRGAAVPPGRYGCLSVADTGTGIPEEQLERIFEPFFTTKGEDAGTGLGLAVVTGLVEQNRGRILVESTPGEGATFRIFFPLASDDTSHDAGRRPEAPDLPAASPPIWSWHDRGNRE